MPLPFAALIIFVNDQLWCSYSIFLIWMIQKCPKESFLILHFVQFSGRVILDAAEVLNQSLAFPKKHTSGISSASTSPCYIYRNRCSDVMWSVLLTWDGDDPAIIANLTTTHKLPAHNVGIKSLAGKRDTQIQKMRSNKNLACPAWVEDCTKCSTGSVVDQIGKTFARIFLLGWYDD